MESLKRTFPIKVLQINTTVNSGSTGRIAEDIGNALLSRGHQSYIAFGRGNRPSGSRLLKIGSQKDVLLHVAKTAVFDRHGFASHKATRDFLKHVWQIRPQVMHLHNIHGYYLNIELLFDFLRVAKIPTVWTLHDSWSYTGHCTFYESVMCRKWLNECSSCPKSTYYPASYVLDQSNRNFHNKKALYADLENLSLVTPSQWLAGEVKRSFLKGRPLHLIYNGVDLDVFRPLDTAPAVRMGTQKKIILGVASTWDKRKGLDVFLELNRIIPPAYAIVLIGLSKKQIKGLPNNMIGVERTENVESLAQYYSAADVFVNPTLQDNFPTTNIEALACGTPVITFNTGGSPEAVDEQTGFVVDKGNISILYDKIELVLGKGKSFYRDNCRKRAVKHFNKNDRYADYLRLYEEIIQRKN